MPDAKTIHVLTVDQYLNEELNSQIKHELIEGRVFAIAGASKNHERIVQNLTREFGVHLKDSSCEPFGSDLKIRVRDNFYYPDLLVDCDVDESETYYTQTPVLIVEVVSKTSRKTDEQHKFLEYINIPSLHEYVMIEQDYVDVTVCRKSEGWRAMHYFLGDDIVFESIDLSLPVTEIYHRVNNEDMLQFLNNQSI